VPSAEQRAGGDERPAGLEQEEAELSLVCGQDGEDRRAREVQRQVQAGLRVEPVLLGRDERGEDEQRPEDLDELEHASLLIAPSSDRVRRELSSGRAAAATASPS
jgi:hypothetical protein